MSIVLGLTGSIGMGKSTVAGMFRAMGVPVFEADREVHRLQAPGGVLVPAIEAAFPGTTSPAAGVDRVSLGERVFNDALALAQLERLVHPAVRRARRAFVRRHAARRLVVLDVPLLFETGGWREVDVVAVVSAGAWRQRVRVMRRRGMTNAKLARIRALQTPDAIKRRRADIVIDTGGSRVATRAQVRAVVACLARRARQ